MSLIPLPKKTGAGKAKFKIIVYCVLMIACVYLFVGLRSFSQGKARFIPKSKQDYIVADVIKDQPDPLATLDIQNRLLINIINAKIANTSDKSKQANDIQSNAESIKYILSYLKGVDSKVFAEKTRKNSYFTFARLMENPDYWRGKSVHFYGVLLQKDLVELPDMPKGLRKMWRLTLTDPFQSHFYTLLTPKISKLVRPMGLVSFDGIFLKRYAYRCQPDPKRPAFWQRTPLFVAKQAYYRWEPRPLPYLLSDPTDKQIIYKEKVNTLNLKQLEPILDVSKTGKGFRSLGKIKVSFEREARNIQAEKYAFEHLFKYMNHFTDEELAKKVDPRINFFNLMKHDRPPKELKWKIGSVVGRVRYVEKHKVKGLSGGLENIYILVIYDESTENFEYRWTVALPTLPHPLRDGDRVRVIGIFTKFFPYQSIKNDWRWTPMLTASKIEVFKPKPSNEPFWVYVIVTILVLFLCYVIYAYNAKDDERRKLMRERIKKKREVIDAIKAVKRIKKDS